MIKIIDCGSQLTQNIARRVRELGVFSEIVPFHTSPLDVKCRDLEGIIISGGQFSVYDPKAPLYAQEILATDVPVLGVCYGHQSIAYLLGGKVEPTQNREYGETKIRVTGPSPLFNRISENKFRVWMSHGDVVSQVPPGFEITAVSQSGHIASMQKRNVYSVQFHPEVDHTEHGRKILDNFLYVCQATRNWDPEKKYDLMKRELAEKLKGKVGIGGISGGVDSSTVSVLINKIVGRNYHPIFVDNGLLRVNEVEQIRESLAPFELNINYVDASERFLSKLRGILNPDKKREIIGNEFIAIFEEEARKIPNVSYLVQGTLYPDVIESVPVYGVSSKIKRHHNVGGLPEKMNLEVIEPFREMFKDEVRKIAEHKLGMPKELVWRHPFPGPGLAIRIIGDITPQNLSMVRQADAIFIEELKKKNLYYKVSQAFAGLISQSTGVMGDEGIYQGVIGLRAVTTEDFMTADTYKFDWNDLQTITNKIINEVKGVSMVVYVTSQKPPSTIEWE